MQLPTLVYILLGILIVVTSAAAYSSLKRKDIIKGDEHYYELKYRLQTVIFAFSTITVTAGFLGIGTYNSLVDKLQQDVKHKTNIFNAKLDSMAARQDSLIVSQQKLEADISRTISQFMTAQSTLQSMESNINKYKRIEKGKETQVYYVKDLDIPLDSIGSDSFYGRKFYFSKLRSIDGRDLPKFNKVPIVSVMGAGADAFIVELTQDYVKFNVSSYYDDQAKDGKYSFGMMVVDVGFN